MHKPTPQKYEPLDRFSHPEKLLHSALVGVFFWFAIALNPALASDRIVVFAPASMSDVLNEIAQKYQSKHGVLPLLSYAGTQQLARQLEAGAPADVFITADRLWMDWAQQKDLLDTQTIRPIAGNKLVVAVRREVENWADISGLLEQDRFGMAEPISVPAGRYAKQALEHLKLWSKVQGNAVFGDNVRVTVRRLALGEVGAALVYGTDVAAEPDVRTLYTFSSEAHEPITYLAALAGRQNKGTAFLSFLASPEAGAAFAKFGFAPAPEGADRKTTGESD